MQTEDTHRKIFPVWEGLKFAGFQQIWRSGEGEAWQMAAEWDREGKLECEGMRPDYEAAREFINSYLPLVPEKEIQRQKENELRAEDYNLVAYMDCLQEKELCAYLLSPNTPGEIDLNWSYEYDRVKVLIAWERICKIVAQTKNVWATEGDNTFLVFYCLGKVRKIKSPHGADLPDGIKIIKAGRSYKGGTGRVLTLNKIKIWWYTIGNQSKYSNLPVYEWEVITNNFRKILPTWWENLRTVSEVSFLVEEKIITDYANNCQTWQEFTERM